MLDNEEIEDVDAEEDEREPQVTSLDPNERKLARKLRIERRLEAIRKLNMLEGEEEEIEAEKTLLQQQLYKSVELLEKLTIESNELVTNVRLANEIREVDRKEAYEINRQNIIDELEKEAEKAVIDFNSISETWTSILSKNDPLLINEEIKNQKQSCDQLIAQKNEVITMLKNKIRDAEINFTRDQVKQTQDIDELADRIEKQVTFMRHAYRKELELIEDVIETERKILLEANDKKWDELFRKRNQEEKNNAERKFQQLEEFEEICTNLRINHQEKYRATKIRLENEIEQLECQLERIKALALINSEKVDYNYQVLKRREDENIIIKSQQKRKINKLQDTINSMRRKIKDFTNKTNSDIGKLSEEVRKLQFNILDIEAKADHFSKLNDDTYKNVWELNSKQANEILRQILDVDKLLHEQQLGIEWTHPENQLLEKTDLPSYVSAMQVITEIYKKGITENYPSKDFSAKTTFEENDEGNQLRGETMAHRRILRIILKMIADKSGFLHDDKLKELLKPYAENQKTLVEIDNVFDALKITRVEDIEVLLEYFLPYTHCPVCMGADRTSFSEESEIELRTENLGELRVEDHGMSVELYSPLSKVEESLTVTDISEIVSAVQQPQEIIEDVLDTSLKDFSASFEEIDTNPINKKLNDLKIVDGKSGIGDETSVGKPSTLLAKVNLDTVSEKSSKSMQSALTTKLSCHNKHPLVISSVYILKALREFVSKFYVAKEGIVTMASRLSHKRSTISRLMAPGEVQMFWDRYKIIFSPARKMLWDGLMFGLQKYHEILKDRKKINDEVLQLRRQNRELTHLLSRYREDLEKKMKPPCAKQRA